MLGGRRAVVTYPELPYPGTALWKIAKLLGLSIATDLAKTSTAMAVFRWHDATFPDPWPASHCNDERVFNRWATDIAKGRLDAAHLEVFGYGLGVDGLDWTGPMVLKPIENARHGGCLVNGPISEIPARHVCQRVVDNTDGQGNVIDLRVVYFDGDIPFAYRKSRPESERFSNTNLTASLTNPKTEFSVDELRAITRLARAMKLDFGEMDVLRDKRDGRIFVCDVNTTPFGPPNHIGREDWVRALDLYCAAFVQMIERSREVATPEAVVA